MKSQKLARSIALVTCLGGLGFSLPSLALEPAGGSPEAVAPPAAEERDASIEEAPARAPVEQTAASGARSWLAKESASPVLQAAAPEGSGAGAGLTLGAVVIVLGLAGGAIYLRFKHKTALPITPGESRLTVLSSSRVGPKAYAVTAHVNGRVLLLGVTDQNVTNLGWLDPPEPEAPPQPRALPEVPDEPEAVEADELPDDYPGSALRASRAPAPVNFATSHELKRFQEVLRGAVAARGELPMRPSYVPGRAVDAAALLAAQTTDVVSAAIPAPAPAPPAPVAQPAVPAAVPTAVSLRRKRRGTREAVLPREPRVAVASRAPRAIDPAFEGQVAGLRALRNGS